MFIGLGVLLVLVMYVGWSMKDSFDQESFAKALARGPLFAGFIAFGAGLVTSMTPCVYPMIAITVSVFGAREESTTQKQAALLSTCFVLGMVTLFVPLFIGIAL